MMDKFEKLETFINSLLEKMIKLLWSLFDKIVPKKLRTKCNELKNKFIQKIKDSLNWTKTKLISGKDKALATKNKTQEKIDQVKSYPLQEKAKTKALGTKAFLMSTPFKSYFKILGDFFHPIFKKLSEKLGPKLKVFSTSHGIMATVALLMILGGTAGIYHSSKDIYQKEFPYREPASVQEYDYRPDYQSYEKKTFKVFNIKVPVFTEKVGGIDSVTIDFSVRTSTRFARYYLTEYEYKLKDYFFTNVEPIVSEFPLVKEGQEVLKEKIIQELNQFLKQEKVEGKVEDVRILYIIGS